MQKRGLIFLAGAAVVLVAIAVVAVATGDREISRASPGERALPALAAKLGDIAVIALSRSDLSATFLRDGESWRLAEKDNYPADAGRIRQVVLALADMTLVEPKTQKPDLYPRLEVEDPGTGKSSLVTVKDDTGAAIAALIIGKIRYGRLGAGTDGVYVRKPDDRRAWLATGSLDLTGAASSWLDRHVLDIPEKRIAAVTLGAADGTRLVVKRAAPEEKFAVEDAPADAKLKSEDAPGEPASALEGLDLDDVKPASEMPVPDSGVVTASYATFDGLKIELRLFAHDQASWIAISATGSDKTEPEAKAINDKVSRWRYAIPHYKASLLETKLADLLMPPKGS